MVSAGESEMTHAEIESQTAAFFAKGGKIQVVPAGQKEECDCPAKKMPFGRCCKADGEKKDGN